MAPTLYLTYRSPPCRAVLIAARAIGLTLTHKEIDIPSGEHLKPEYLKINPQHTIPTLVDDDGFAIWDSHAIIIYLISKYAKNDALYPKDLKKRAVIDQRLHFDGGVAFNNFLRIVVPHLYEGKTVIDQNDRDLADEVYGFLEAFLDGKEWAAGHSVTIADYALIATVGTLNTVIPVDTEKFSKVVAWIKRVEGLPEYDANVEGQKEFAEKFEARLRKT